MDVPGVATEVWNGAVNYYRLPDTIRIEARYDEIREAVYGSIEAAPVTGGDPVYQAFDRPMFFWVKKVRLVKEAARTVANIGDKYVWDVVELEISPDVWSNNQGKFQLFDSYIERRHMDRWDIDTTDPDNPVYIPRYYPNAAQGVDGAMKVEADESLTPKRTVYYHQGQADEDSIDVSTKCFIVTVIDSNGEMKRIVGMDPGVTLYETYSSCRYLGVSDLLDGTFYTAAGITADFVQSILIFPYSQAAEAYDYRDSGGTKYLTVGTVTAFDKHTSGAYAWLEVKPSAFAATFKFGGFSNLLAPDLTYLPASDPTGAYDHDEHEPMMYLAPARVRKFTTGIGGELATIPDIRAFEDAFMLSPMNDVNSAVILIYPLHIGTNPITDVNAEGALGCMECGSLPVYNSAWKSYDAINKVGDEIAYNAHQAAAIANGVSSGVGGAVMGMLGTGNPAGALLGVLTGAVSTTAGVYSTAEELRAKQTTIRNSPSNVKSGGSGLGAYQTDVVDPHYITMRMDDQSMEKLRSMYYWYGYHVNRTFKGVIDLQVRRFFDFIKTDGARVRGDLNAEDAQAIAAIFDKGVTIVHTHSDATNYGYISQSVAGELYNNDEQWLI